MDEKQQRGIAVAVRSVCKIRMICKNLSRGVYIPANARAIKIGQCVRHRGGVAGAQLRSSRGAAPRLVVKTGFSAVSLDLGRTSYYYSRRELGEGEGTTDKGRLPARPRPPLQRGVERGLGLGVVVVFVGKHRRVQQLHDAIDHDLEHHGPSCEAVDEALGLAGR